MSAAFYQAFGLLKDDTDFDMRTAARRLSERMDWLDLSWKDDGIRLSSDEWEIEVDLNEQSWVVEESKGLAEMLAHSPRADAIAQCSRRVEVNSHLADPDMDHFNDFIMLCEVLSTFKGVILIDPQGPDFI